MYKEWHGRNVVFSFLISVIFLLGIYLFCGIWFETNDDVAISELLSGKITGLPDYHCPYVRTLIAWPISCLYRLTTKIPWWGILIFAVLFFVVFLNLFFTMKEAKSFSERITVVVAEMAVFVSGIHCFGQAQYTAAAILLAFTGYVVLIVSFTSKRKPSWGLFLVCELLACGIRDSAMILAQPIGLAILLGLIIANKKEEGPKSGIRALLIVIIMIASIFAVSKIDYTLTFSKAQWKEYERFNDVRTLLMDYERKIPYNELSDILEKYEISETEYEQALYYRMWYKDIKFSGECLEKLKPRLSEIRKGESINGNFLAAFSQLLLTSHEFWHLHQFTFIVFILMIVISVITKIRRMLIVDIFAFAGYVTGIAFLAYRNRFVLRVMLPYYLGSLLLLFAVSSPFICEMIREKYNRKGLFYCGCSLMIALIPVALQIGRVQFAYVRAQNNLVNAVRYSEGIEIAEYCKKHPDNHYLLDMSYSRFTSTDVFERAFYSRANHVYSGSWMSNTPPMVNYSKAYLGDEFYCMVYEAQEFKGLDGVDYYAAMMNTEKELVEKFKMASGATMWVYKISK